MKTTLTLSTIALLFGTSAFAIPVAQSETQRETPAEELRLASLGDDIREFLLRVADGDDRHDDDDDDDYDNDDDDHDDDDYDDDDDHDDDDDDRDDDDDDDDDGDDD